MLLVEQHVHQAMNYADRAYVVQRGRIRFHGMTDELRGRFDEIQTSYLSTPSGTDGAASSAGESTGVTAPC